MTESPINHRPEHYVHAAGAVVYVPRHVSAWLDKRVNFDRLRERAREEDREVWAVLVALRTSAMSAGSADGTDRGTDLTALAELAAESAVMTTTEVAERLTVTPRAVCKAIAAQRLPAEKRNGAWLVSRQDFERYRINRLAA